ncbi:MAG: hypothetical protein HY049_12950 [Acidobacteria bacterium]|nr:hypothetical protein [Acidobacteriota bacterium]
MDPATLMILRASAGERGKVDIGGRIYIFSSVTTFYLRDEATGFLHICGDSVSLLRKILDLLRDARRRSQGRYFRPEPSG